MLAELEGVAQSQGACGLYGDVLCCACVSSLHGFTPLLPCLEAVNSGLPIFLEPILGDKNKNSSSCAVKGFFFSRVISFSH